MKWIKKQNYFACFACFHPEAVDDFPRVTIPKSTMEKDMASSPTSDGGYIKSADNNDASSSGSKSSTSTSENEDLAAKPPKPAVVPRVVPRGTVTKGKTQSDVTDAVSTALKEETPTGVVHEKGLSCHPVLMQKWSLVSSIVSDEEEGEGHASDYEC